MQEAPGSPNEDGSPAKTRSFFLHYPGCKGDGSLKTKLKLKLKLRGRCKKKHKKKN